MRHRLPLYIPDSPPLVDQLSLRILTINQGAIDEGWNKPMGDSFWRIYLNENDGAALKTKRGLWEIIPGRIHVIPAWYEFQCFCEGVVNHFFVHFEMQGLTAAATKSLFPNPVRFPENARLETEAHDVRRRCCPPNSFGLLQQAIAKAYATRVWALLMEQLPHDADQSVAHLAHVSEQIAPALQWVKYEIANPISVEDLANACHLSVQRFFQAFRHAVGVTPTQYILDRRIDKASHLLATTDMDMEDVAVECGFPDRFYFTRVFTKRKGNSPARFRKEARKLAQLAE